MKILTTGKFKHEKETYEENTEYDVDPSIGYYFIGVGWAVDPTKIEQEGNSTLDIHGSKLGVSDTNG